MIIAIKPRKDGKVMIVHHFSSGRTTRQITTPEYAQEELKREKEEGRHNIPVHPTGFE